MAARTTPATGDAVQLLTEELALIGRTPTAADIQAVMRFRFKPARYLIHVDGSPFRFATNRLHARVAARSAGHIHPEATIEVEYRPTGELATASLDGSFVHREGVYHYAGPR